MNAKANNKWLHLKKQAIKIKKVKRSATKRKWTELEIKKGQRRPAA